jgi:hypothetical protein
VKKFVKSIARFFGYEIRKITPPVPAGIKKFFNAPEGSLDSDVGTKAAEFGPMPHGEPNAPHPKDSGQAAKSLIVEGWRFLATSYAIVNQWQLLALSRRTDVAVKVIDLPFLARRWQTQEGLFEQHAEQALRSIEIAKPDESADVTLRISFPFDFSPSRSRQTAVFGTSESQIIRKTSSPIWHMNSCGRHRCGRAVVTPSRWSAEGFYKVNQDRTGAHCSSWRRYRHVPPHA